MKAVRFDFDVEKVNVVYMTYEYERFKKIAGNRSLNKKNLKRLEESMKKKQLEIPITVNEKMEIVDGQHRFYVCKKLEIPVYFILVHEYGVKEVIQANTVSEKWKTSDFIDSHSGMENKEYEFLNHIINKGVVKTSTLETIISKVTGKKNNEIKEEIHSGELKLTIGQKSEVLEFISSILKFGEGKKYRSRAFILTYIEMYFFDGIDRARLEKLLVKNKESRIGDYITKEMYLKEFTRIYNVKLTRKIHVSESTGKLFFQGER